MTDAELRAIREREQAATPGPWHLRVLSQVAAEVYSDCPCCGIIIRRVEPWDGELIAHARTDMPALLAEVERMRAENDSLRTVTQRIRALVGQALAEPTEYDTEVLVTVMDVLDALPKEETHND